MTSIRPTIINLQVWTSSHLQITWGWNKINFKYTEEMTNEHSNSLIFWQLTWIILALWFLFSFKCLTWPVLVPTSFFLGIISVEYGQVTLNYRRCYLMTNICILETQYQSFSLYSLYSSMVILSPRLSFFVFSFVWLSG